MRLRIASRKSDLARWQALEVARQFQTLADPPQCEFIYKASLGDLDLDTPLAGMPTKGVFTEDFYKDLVQDQCDVVVHSWKDLPVGERPATHVAMTLPRADVRDLLLVPESAWARAVEEGCLTILTSSPRRVYNLSLCLKSLLPVPLKLEFTNVRGNVPTRINKMLEQNVALVLAKAGLDRLLAAEAENFITTSGLRALIQGCRFMVLPISLNPAAAAQGALAVEVRRHHQPLNQWCEQLNHQETAEVVREEREILAGYGGGCQQKIGVSLLPRDFGQVVSVRGLTEQGEVLQRWEIRSSTPWTRAESGEQIFPHCAKDNSWFERKSLSVETEVLKNRNFFVARIDAWPSDFRPDRGQFIWTAGVRTWQRLAEKGIWVHGTSDGLGESESLHLETLCGPLRWTKLSHRGGQARPETPLLISYELQNRSEFPNLLGKTHFFWMSSSSFERARQLFPEVISQGYHASGPGSTHTHLKNAAGLKFPPKVFIDLPQFLNQTLPQK